MNELRPITSKMVGIAACIGLAFMILLLIFSAGFWGALFWGIIVGAIALFVMMLGWVDSMIGSADTAPNETVSTPVPTPAEPPTPVAAPVADSAPAVEPEPVAEPEPIAEPVAAPKPAPKPAPVVSDAIDSGKPTALAAARDGGADDLKLIKGVGPKLEDMLNGMGIYHFDQVASWGPAEQKWVDENLKGFKGRATRDKWVEQAKELAGE